MMMAEEEEEEAPPQMITLNNGTQIPFTIVKPKSKPPPFDYQQLFPLMSSRGSVAYPTDDHPAIIKTLDPAGGDKYHVNPMIAVFQRMQQNRFKVSPCMKKLLDDYHDTLIKHPEIAAYISATEGENSICLPPPPSRRMLLNMKYSASSDNDTFPFTHEEPVSF